MSHLYTEGFQELTKVDDALKMLFGALGEQDVELESVALRRALGRHLGKDVVAGQYLPSLDRSVMDGYAVRVEDVKNASRESPAILWVVGESRIGALPRMQVKPGESVAVATGSVVPSGTDAVVMIERTTKLPAGRIAVYTPAIPGQSIAMKGEDVAPGRAVLKRGVLLRPQDIGILKALGLSRVYVARKPRVALLSTGSELVDSTIKRDFAKVIDVNRAILSGLLQELGAKAVDFGIVEDRKSSIRNAIRKGLKMCDAVIVTAGSSVGKKDLVPQCVNTLGKPGMLVHGVAMRPAMPTGLAVVNHSPVFSLPGYPVSAFFAFRTFVRPVLARMLGARELFEPTVTARLSERISGAPDIRTFVRVVVSRHGEEFTAKPLKLQRSSVLMSMVAANGIVTLREGATAAEAGQYVDVTLVGGILP